MSAKEERDYSFIKAVRGLVNGSGLQGLEREVSEEIAKRAQDAKHAAFMHQIHSGAVGVI